MTLVMVAMSTLIHVGIFNANRDDNHDMEETDTHGNQVS